MLKPHTPQEFYYKQDINKKINHYKNSNIIEAKKPFFRRKTLYTRGKLLNRNIDMSQRCLRNMHNNTINSENILNNNKFNDDKHDLKKPFQANLMPRSTTYPINSMDHTINFNFEKKNIDKFQQITRNSKCTPMPSFVSNTNKPFIPSESKKPLQNNIFINKNNRISNEKLFDYNFKRLSSNNSGAMFDNKPIDSRKKIYTENEEYKNKTYGDILKDTYNN